MTIASLLLALLTVTSAPPSDAVAAPVLLDFHAEWCGPCKQVRPAIQQLIQNRYPVKSIDIDKDSEIATRYGVDRVPTFVVVNARGRELDRTSGPQSAAALARFYLAAKAKVQPPENSNAHAGDRDDSRQGSDDDDAEPAEARPRARRDDPDDRPEPETQRSPSSVNPHPAETVVRIKIIGPHSTGFGSGTIIHSTPDQSIILTCAHIFKLEGTNRQASPQRFPRKIVIDLFDGKLKGTNPAKVDYLESVEGEAVDYDFTRDVGLIRIRPGRKLAASRVVPAHWEPKSKPLPMKMLTLGCSEGNDATAWYTKILNPRMQGLAGNPSYEAIECWKAPKQGRSGGGLFTTDYYIAGVCNFAEPRGDHGLYATPRSIYSMLDRNNLTALYAPVSRGSATLVADGRSPSESSPSRPLPARPRRSLTPIARSQSPDSDEPQTRRAVEPQTRRAVAGEGEVVTLPPPSLLGISDPVAPGDESRSPGGRGHHEKRRLASDPDRSGTPRSRSEPPSRPISRSSPARIKSRPARWTIRPRRNRAGTRSSRRRPVRVRGRQSKGPGSRHCRDETG